MGYSLKDFCINYTLENKYKQGVYKIYHLKNVFKLYIGSASGTYKYGGFTNRFNRHFRDLLSNKHCNKKLQNFINKYGLEGIRFEILEVCSPNECIEREQFYFDTLNPYFNIAKVAGNTLGVRPTIKQLKRVSKPILQYSLNGDFIKEWAGSTFIQEKLGFNKSSIMQCCYNKNNNLQSHGYQWRFKTFKKYPLNINKYENPQAYKLLCYKKSGKFYKEYNSILSASRDLNIDTGNISRVLSRKIKFYKDYIFKKYIKNYSLYITPVEKTHKHQFKVTIKTLDNIFIKEYKSFREVTNDGIISRSTLTQKVKNNILNFIFKNKYIIEIENINNNL